MQRHRPIVFVPLAGNQARFYAGVGQVLRRHGADVSAVTFHEPSLGALESAGLETVSAYREPVRRVSSVAEALDRIAAFDVPDVGLAISHERAAYEIRDGAMLVHKFLGHLDRMYSALGGLRSRHGDIEVVHELGGFLSVAATFYAARRLGLRNTFIEPSFYRQRLFFTRDTFAAPTVSAPLRTPTPEVRAYLSDALSQKRIVIPDKDRPHYRSAARKILSGYNVRRLLEKGRDKYVRRHREEFDHLGGHVRRHLRMLRTAQRLRPFYRELPVEPFVYYPFHVPADVALTIRAPEYYDQYALLDYLARLVPPSHRLVVKEHPALIGAVDYYRVTDLLRRYDHLILLRPTINNHDVLQRATAVVTVNSKSGAEALLRGGRVVALGDSFYRRSGLVFVAENAREVGPALHSALDAAPPSLAAVEQFFQQVFDSSRPGELYLDTPANCEAFADSLSAALHESLEPAAGGQR